MRARPHSAVRQTLPARRSAAASRIEVLESRIAPAVVVNINLADLNGTDGFKLSGVAAGDLSGYPVSDAGDVNGDGFDDLLLGAFRASPNGSYSGASYVVFGKADFSATAGIQLSTLNGTNGFRLGGAAYDSSGFSVSAAGDVNGDGFGDLLIGAPGAERNGLSNSGASYVIFGKEDFSATAGNFSLSSLNGSNGFVLSGVAEGDSSGSSVNAAGDVNGDGFDDLLIGTSSAAPNGAHSGESYVVFGKPDFSATAGNLNLSALDGSNGFVLSGVAEGDYSGISVSAAGDINGDGFDDLLIGAYRADPNGSQSGASYVVFGKADFSATARNLDLSTLNGSNGFKLSGGAAYDQSGRAVSAAGDVNGDGFDDLLVGANEADPNGNSSGASYVVFGNTDFSATAGNFNLSGLNGSNGFMISGGAGGDQSGFSVSGAGDVNGDGFDDLLIGAYRADPNGDYSGVSYVVFGKANFTGNLKLSLLDGANGFKLSGVADGDRSGRSVSVAGDVNGDGFDDLLIGAPFADPHGASSGASYVVFGFDTGAVSPTGHGTSAGETLNGTADADVIIGGRGDDTLASLGGADVFHAGQGDDILAIGDLTFHRLDGGTGFDTLRLDGAGLSLNLKTLADNRLNSIEQIDLTGTGNHTLSLNRHEVLAISDDSTALHHSNTLLVLGDAGDAARIGLGWTTGVDEIIGLTTFRVFTSGAAILKIAAAVSVDTNLVLASLSRAEGFALNGVAEDDQSGFSVSDAGDVNGDGFDDLLIGAHYADPNGDKSGASYVVFGKAGGFAANLDLTTLDGTNGFKLSGVAAGDCSGGSVSAAGDVNGDGFDDLLIGAFGAGGPQASPTYKAGASYVVFGKADFSASAGKLNLSTLNGSNGFKLSGAATRDYSGCSVSAAGDVNGDGFADLLIGAENGNPNDSGASYVVFGKAGGFVANLNLSTLNGTNGFKLSGGADNDRSGISVSGAGDVNGDGFDDLLIGAHYADPHGSYSGASYVVFGKADFSAAAGNFNLSTLSGNNGFKLSGIADDDRSGHSVSAAGDVNGDGFDDLLIGAHYADPHGDKSGASYVVFGKASGWTGTFELSTLVGGNGTDGFQLSGVATGDNSGFSVSGAGDVNGDGFDDLLIGAYRGPNNTAYGASYVVFGKANFSGLTNGNLNLSTLNGTNGFKLSGVAGGDMSGFSVSGAGDVNGDGFDDLLIGAQGADPHGNDSGASYVVFGFDTGGVGAETITDTAGDHVLIGGAGGDTLIGNGGADVLRGGQGSDVLAISDLTFRKIQGGTGFDTLRLDGAGLSLNLKSLADNRLTGIEQIDLTGSGNNTLKLNLHEVLALSDSSNTLIVQRDLGDVVVRGLGWTPGSPEMIGLKTYDVFTQGAAKLKIQQVTAAPVNAKTINATHPFVFQDANSDEVTVKLTGKGSAIAVLNGGLADGADLVSLALTDTDTKSKLTVTVKKDTANGGDGFAPIGEVTVVGGLAAFTAASSDLGTGLNVTGLVKAIVLRDLLRGEITVGGAATDSLAITAHSIASGTEITTASTLKSITVKGGGAGGDWSGPAFNAIAVTGGALSANIASVGAIAKITVKGGGLSGHLSAASFGAVSISGGDFSGSLTSLTSNAALGKTAALKSLTVTDGDLTGDVRLHGKSGAITVKGEATGSGGNVTGASIVASHIAGLTVANNFNTSIVLAGADLGADYAFGGAGDTFAGGTIGAVTIGGEVTGISVIGAGFFTDDANLKDLDDDILDPATSIIKSLTITGDAALESYFIAGSFKTPPKIHGGPVDNLANDTRFKVAPV